MWPTSTPCSRYVPILKFFSVFEIFDHKMQIFGAPLVGNRCRRGNHFVLLSLGVRPDVSFEVWTWYDHLLLSYCKFLLYTLRYFVTLTFDFLTLESCRVMPLGCSIPIPSLNWIRLTVPELGRLQFSNKFPICTFLGVKGVKFSNFVKGTTLARTTHNDVLSVGVRPKVRPVAVTKRPKNGQKLSCVKQALPRPLSRCIPWNFACGVVSGK